MIIIKTIIINSMYEKWETEDAVSGHAVNPFSIVSEKAGGEGEHLEIDARLLDEAEAEEAPKPHEDDPEAHKPAFFGGA